MLAEISMFDWALVAAALISAGLAWLAKQQSLPAGARRWLGRIGQEKVLEIIKQAEAFAEMTPDEKRRWAVAALKELTLKRLGFEIPTSVANLLVEFVYVSWKRMKK